MLKHILPKGESLAIQETEELENFYRKAVEFVDKNFPEVKQYIRDYRSTILTVMRFLIDLETLKVEKAKLGTLTFTNT